jgi:hypothetical protein
MTFNSRSCASAVLSAAALSLILIAGRPAAAADELGAKPRGLINNPTRAANSALPEHARANTGTTGQLDKGAFSARKFQLTLNDGREVVARLQRVVKDDNAGQQSWVGTVDAEPGSIFVMTKYRGVTTGFLTLGTETWELMPAPGGKFVLYQVDDDKIPTLDPDGAPDGIDPDAGAADVIDRAADDFGTGGAIEASNGGYVHDLLVVYTTAAREVNGRATLESQIRNAVVATNQAYQNSGINVTLNLVGMREVAYTASDLRTATYALRDTSDGKMDNIHSIRDSLGADMVSLVTKGGSGCGWGFIMSYERAGFESSAFSAAKMSCLSSHTLVHELGHNQGSDHNRESAALSSTVFPYSYGFRRCNTNGSGFRTIMSYSCSGAPRIAHFSNPRISYNGYATGIAYESNPNNSSDNARSINNTAATVSAFRKSSGGTTETRPSAPSSLSANADSSSRITVRWSDNSNNETGFRLERSGNGVDYSEIATLGANATTYSDSGLAASSTYYYRVRAYNSAGNSSYSNTNSARTDGIAQPPSAPSSLSSSSDSSSRITVRWSDNSNNESGFRLERSRDGVNFGQIATLNANTTTYINSGLAASTTYYYRVRAYNSAGNSSFSNTGSATTAGAADAPPAKPTSISASNNGDGTSTVTWTDASSNETGFEIRREKWNDRKSRWGNVSNIGPVGAGVTRIVDQTGPGTFRYSVRAVNASGKSGYAGPRQVTVTGGKGGGGGKGRKK